ncbi:MAG TPA: lipoyl synthase [Nitrospirae bacterium]|nr:lipoyl synthase [Nitrospirota bacterium]
MRLPEWLKTKEITGHHDTKHILRRHGLNTVCEEARCPNRGVCFSRPTATFLILGDRCTRNCGFCSVSSGTPQPLDTTEPERVARAAAEMKLRYVVITSVTRDDLPDGGARQFALTVRMIRSLSEEIKIEVLTPDFKGQKDALEIVLNERPDVFNHNVETVPRLYPVVRPQADYKRSLRVLEMAKEIKKRQITKSGLMVGLGETFQEVVDVLRDLRSHGCDMVTIGQYLRPGKDNIPVVEYVTPGLFDRYRDVAYEMGFSFVASGPLVRSSMNAEEMYTLSR